MKILLQRTLQSILNAELAGSSMTANGNGSLLKCGISEIRATRILKTKQGALLLKFPIDSGRPAKPQLFAHYPAEEMRFLVCLGRMLVRGCTWPGAVRELVESACGHPLGTKQVTRIAAAIDEELPNYFQRELEGSHMTWSPAHA
jgi:hypothetical protein